MCTGGFTFRRSPRPSRFGLQRDRRAKRTAMRQAAGRILLAILDLMFAASTTAARVCRFSLSVLPIRFPIAILWKADRFDDRLNGWFYWYSWVDSNHRPPDPQSGALTN